MTSPSADCFVLNRNRSSGHVNRRFYHSCLLSDVKDTCKEKRRFHPTTKAVGFPAVSHKVIYQCPKCPKKIHQIIEKKRLVNCIADQLNARLCSLPQADKASLSAVKTVLDLAKRAREIYS